MMTFKDQCSAMDDMADQGCLIKARADLEKVRAKVAHHKALVSAGAIEDDPKARCYLQLKDAEMVVAFLEREVTRRFDHAAEAQALAGRPVDSIALDLRAGEVVA